MSYEPATPPRMPTSTRPTTSRSERGFTLIELMISMTLSLVILAALVGMFVNTSRTNNELQNVNSLIENGRFTLQLLETDLVHGGYWAGYMPQFDDLTSTAVPGDVPSAVPDVCAAYNTWDQTYRSNMLGIPMQAYDTLPACVAALSALAQRAGTDVLVVRHADTCVPGTANCDADVAGRLYFQPSLCAAEANAGKVVIATSNTVTLDANTPGANNEYVGLTIRVGDSLFNSVTGYNPGTKLATLSTAWAVPPAPDTPYSFEYVLGTNQFPLHRIDCVGTGIPATLPVTAGPNADKRLFVSNIYYVLDYAHPDRAGEVIPTLVRSQFDLSGGTLAHQAPVALIEGVEGFRVELGIDNVSETLAAVDYTDAVIWDDPDEKTRPTNRGDGHPDAFKRCTTLDPCTVDELTNVVAVKLYVLARSRDTAPGHTDNRTYCLGEFAANGSCPAANRLGPFNDSYKRHVFSTSVRLVNVSARRETPP